MSSLDEAIRLDKEAAEREANKRSIRTLCSGCCFATYDKDACQDGCMVGRLEKWHAKEKVESLDDGTCAILDYCNMARHPLWLEKYGPDFFPALNDEVFPKVDAIVPILKDDTIENVKLTLISLVQEGFNEIIMPLENDDIQPKELFLFCQDLYKTTVKFQINDHVSKTQWLGDAINRGVDRSKATFYMVLQPGQLFKNTLLPHLDSFINQRLEKVILVEADKENPMLVHRLAHVQLGGNRLIFDDGNGHDEEIRINEMIREKAREDGHNYLIRRWDEIICNTLK